MSNESWSIMKNMATELGIILIGYFTLVPAIQVLQHSTRAQPFFQTHCQLFGLCPYIWLKALVTGLVSLT